MDNAANHRKEQQQRQRSASQIDRTLYREYRNALAKLTFNSRPIINELSKKAEAHIDQTDTVVKAIEDHLRFTVPKHKLPVFYLLDSIIKNVGGMYISSLHGRIEKIFMEMYKSVDDTVKRNMERTLGTWRHGFVGGTKNIFPEFVLRKIEEDLSKLKARARETAGQRAPDASGDDLLDNLSSMQSYEQKRAQEARQEAIQRSVLAKADGRASGGNGSKRHSERYENMPLPPPKRQRTPEGAKDASSHNLLQEVNKLLLKKKVELLRRPNDVLLFTVLNTLKDIKTIVAETDLPRERIEEIRQQLNEIDGADATKTSNGGSTTPPYPPPLQRHQQPNQNKQPPPAAANSSSGGQTDPNQLLQNLMSRPDLISSLSKVAPGLSTSLGAMLVPQHQQGSEGYASFQSLEPIPLTHTSIVRERPGIHNILYQGYPNLCSQCGWRTTGDEAGQTAMRQHMDMHFRRNMRSQDDRVRRAAARGWFVEKSKWEAGKVLGDADDDSNGDSANGDGAASAGNADQEAEGAMVAELQKMTVAVSAAQHANDTACAICKEAFERRFNEDDEEWEFVNAVVADSTLYHATCHANVSARGGAGHRPDAKPLGPVAAPTTAVV
ncbi:mRNA 3' end processing factor [Coemansia sp. RSA 1813]|nr:mRNA 3' end processing factor [Coemansia sp. RSA 1843]KAJ2565279.1 mRNA 3' end processing factor [Coemansia sp. RSA 1813]